MIRANDAGLRTTKGARFLPPVAFRLLIAALALIAAASAAASSVFAQTQSSDASLSGMTFYRVDGTTLLDPVMEMAPTFSSTTTTYSIAVTDAPALSAITVAAATTDSNATVAYYQDGSAATDVSANAGFQINLSASNAVTILVVRVTAEDTTTTMDYTFYIYRNSSDYDADDDGYIDVWTRLQLEAIY